MPTDMMNLIKSFSQFGERAKKRTLPVTMHTLVLFLFVREKWREF
jgi:hypothetical protein